MADEPSEIDLPDQPGPGGRSVAEQFRLFLEEKTGKKGPKCPICQNREWVRGENVLAIRPMGTDKDEASASGGAVYPVVVLVCTDCGYTAMFNAVVTGVIKPEAGDPS